MRSITRGAVLGAVASLLLLAPLQAQDPAGATMQDGVEEGSTQAFSAGTEMWTVAGFTGGLLAGPIGTGLAYALAASTDTGLPKTLSSRISRKGGEYSLGFQQAYTQTLIERRKRSALVGGLAGTALLVTSYLVLDHYVGWSLPFGAR